MRFERSLEAPSFSIENLDVLEVTRDEGYTYSYRNGRTKYGFIYVVSGYMDYNFLSDGGPHFPLCKGEMIFIPKGSTYVSTYREDRTQIRIVQFDLSEGQLPPYLHTPAKLPLPNAGELIGAFFRPMQSHAFGHSFHSLSCFYQLLWQIDEHCTRIPSRYKKLLSALNALSAHPEDHQPICQYAALCNMSEPNFRRLFREYTGQSPVEYRNGLRLSAARAKLQSGQYTVSEAAEASGFSNLSFFIRLYKKRYGITPKKE